VEWSKEEMGIEKLWYWIKNLVKNRRNCRRFCLTCEFYDICKREENENKNTGKRDH